MLSSISLTTFVTKAFFTDLQLHWFLLSDSECPLGSETAQYVILVCMGIQLSTTCHFQTPTEDHVLVYWQGEECVSAVTLRNIVDPCVPVINRSCAVQTGKNMYNFLAIQMGAYSMHTPAGNNPMVQGWDKCSAYSFLCSE